LEPDWNALTQSGTSAGYGVEWYLGSPTPPRNIRIAYVDPGTPGAQQGLVRGMTLVSVNGVSADDGTQAGVSTLNEALFAPKLNATYTFVVSTGGAQQTKTVTATTVTTVPVQNAKVIDTPNGKVGYLTFNTHILPAESQLVSAFTTFASARVDDLVLDLRYNGGGFLFLASQVGYMVAGGTRTSGKTFEKLIFNDKRTADNNDPDNNTPFYNVTSGVTGTGTTANQPLPQLNLSRVFVLTSRGTCSASESLVNALRGIDVQVILIGDTTCGKPFGFTAKDNCGISYFPIEFRGANQKGFGDYADGFSASCAVPDDLSKQLGDPTERQLAAALTYRTTGACPTAGASAARAASAGASAGPGQLVRHPARENKYRVAQ
jgi:carboxyl-terminal processing protease